MKNGAILTGPTAVLLQWTHLVGTFDGTNTALYVNGNLVASLGGTANNNYIPANFDGIGRPANIGNARFAGTPYYAYQGEIDEVAFYTNALTLNQVQAHYQVGTNSLPLPPQPPIVLKDPENTTNYANTPLFRDSARSGTPITSMSAPRSSMRR